MAIRSQNDHASGTELAETLDGVFFGGRFDTLTGGGGNDLYLIDFTGQWDLVVEEPGAAGGIDTVELRAFGTTYFLTDNVENLRLHQSAGATNANGNALNNNLLGNNDNNFLNGGDGNDVVDGGIGSDNLQGGYGTDTVDAGPEGVGNRDYGNDTLIGDVNAGVFTNQVQLGNDILNGNSFLSQIGNSFGNDVLVGDAAALLFGVTGGNDTLNAGSGGDRLYGDATSFMGYGSRGGNDILNGDPSGAIGGSDVLIGDSGGDMNGRGGNDTLNAGAGFDWLYGDAGGSMNGGFGGVDILNGGDGNDVLSGDARGSINAAFSASANTFYGGVGGNDTLNGGAGNDRMYGDALATINDQARGGNDTLAGGDGNDYLAGDGGAIGNGGRGGNDTLNGGAGNDTLLGDAFIVNGFGGNDALLGGSGNDRLYGDGQINNGTGGNDVLNGEAGDDLLYGGSGNDNLLGGAGNDFLYGQAGNDRFEGGAGDDTYWLVQGNDLPIVEAAGGGNDTVYFAIETFGQTFTLAAEVENVLGVGPFFPFNTGASVTLIGNASANYIEGNGGFDRLVGLAGNDVLDGGFGADTLEGGAGNDIYEIDNTGDVVIEGAAAGTDTVRTTLTTYTLGANVENVTFLTSGNAVGRGNALNNVMTGNNGNDRLIGEGGDDVLNGGVGVDVMIGGAGNDTYVVDQQGGLGLDDRTIEAAGGGTDTVRLAAGGGFANNTYELEQNVENVVALTGAVVFKLVGNALNNAMDGNEFGNEFIGGLGNDTMRGFGGHDTYYIEQLGDTVTEGANAGFDTVRLLVAPGGAAGHLMGANIEQLIMDAPGAMNATGNLLDNWMYGNGAANRLDGANGNDRLYGGRGNDTLLGGIGNDFLDGGAGADVMNGGVGNDTYVIDSVLDQVSEAAGAGTGTDTIRALFSFNMNVDGADADAIADGLNVENLVLLGSARFGTGNGLNNVITGNGLANVLVGLGGNDTLDGQGGTDRMTGGAGNDTFIVDSAADDVFEAAGQGTDLVRSTTGLYQLDNGQEVENLTLVEGSGAVNGYGQSTDAIGNVITGNSANNHLRGFAGSDTLTGLAGDDGLFGGDGNDVLNGGDGDDNLYGNANDDTLNADAGSDDLYGGTGDDVLAGGDGADSLYGNEGNDTLAGGNDNDRLIGDQQFGAQGFLGGVDTLNGGAGNDRLYGDAYGTLNAQGGNDILNGDAGNDTIYGDARSMGASGLGGSDTIHGGDGNDRIFGDAGAGTDSGAADTLFGDAGDDTLYGGGGNDVMAGGAGRDVLVGGSGADAMNGGDGDDTFFIDNSGDTVIEAALATSGANDTIILVNNTMNINLAVFAPNVENVTAGFSTSGRTLTGTAGNNVLTDQGGAGTFLIGGAGNDTYRFNSFDANDTAGDTAGTDNLTATLNGDLLTPTISGIEFITFVVEGNTNSNITGSQITGAQRLTLVDNTLHNLTTTLGAMKPLVDGVFFSSGYTGGAVVYNNDVATPGDVVFTLDNVSISLETNVAVLNQTFHVVGTGQSDVSVAGLNDELRITGGTGALLQLANIDETDTYIVLDGYQGQVNLFAFNNDPGLETLNVFVDGANAVAGGNLEVLALTATGAASFLNFEFMASAGTVALTGGANLTIVRAFNNTFNASAYTGNLDLRYADGGNVFTAGTGNDSVRFTAGGNTANFGTNLNGADYVSGSGSDTLNATINGLGTALLPAALRLEGIGTVNLTTAGAASVLSFEESTGLGTVVILDNGGPDFNLTLLDVNADVTAQTNYDGQLTLELGDANPYLATGGRGADTLTGGTGDDTIRGDSTGNIAGGGVFSASDILRGGAGNDTIFGDTTAELQFGATGGNDRLEGGAGNDILTGDASDHFEGGSTGIGGNDILFGGDGDDTISGDFSIGVAGDLANGGNDVLYGGDGNDTLLGGRNANSAGSDFDTFVFDTLLGPGNVDTILDFFALEDTIRLDDDIFVALSGLGGVLTNANAVFGFSPFVAQDANDFIIYDQANGALYYDGDGAGGAAAVQFATVQMNGAPASLSAADFVIVT